MTDDQQLIAEAREILRPGRWARDVYTRELAERLLAALSAAAVRYRAEGAVTAWEEGYEARYQVERELEHFKGLPFPTRTNPYRTQIVETEEEVDRMFQMWGIDRPDEVTELTAERLSDEMQAAIDHGGFSPLARAVFVEVHKRFMDRGTR